ncbi:hypothetical protein [Pectobacterium phage Wc4-1]|uniref:Uncharacterized protein n=3 Tax=Arnovirus TaxID=3425109 RepID=A0A5P8D4B1_9CAUD|nr:hypothetical protein Arno162_116 [Pectobacterium phage Arno162]AZV02303.1 hypothetical protein Arno18_117 [Pectobacterium phage Arno18]QFP93833.1 hypothetical protein [Pectobacterium phage Wc4]QFP93978.1 hypothetical protein [Pectobacterium phage Wc4-1]
MAKKAKFSKAFLQVFGASMAATEGKSADHFAAKRIRTGKTARDHQR